MRWYNLESTSPLPITLTYWQILTNKLMEWLTGDCIPIEYFNYISRFTELMIFLNYWVAGFHHHVGWPHQGDICSSAPKAYHDVLLVINNIHLCGSFIHILINITLYPLAWLSMTTDFMISLRSNSLLLKSSSNYF